MIITSEPTAKGNRINIYIDGEYDFTIDSEIWYTCGYSNGDSINEDELTNLKNLVGSRLAFSSALRILTLRSNSQKELHDKLLKKYPDFAVDYAIEKCIDLGFINDEDFALRYAQELYEKKHFGKERIKQELKIKGICSELIENAVESLDINPVMSIINIINSKYLNCIDDEKGKRRIYNALGRLGYGSYDIRKALEIVLSGDEYFE